jgi:hypothetical protein
MRAGPRRGGEDQGKAPGDNPGSPETIRVGWKAARTRAGAVPGHLDAPVRSPGMRQPPRLADAAADAPAVAGIGGLLPSL